MIILINHPHAARVLRDHFNFTPNVDFIAGDNGDGRTGIDWLSATAMPSVAAIEAVTVGQAIATAATRIAQAAKSAATSGIDSGAAVVGDKTERLVRALMEIILDEFNLHALKHNAVLDAIDAAASLAALKTAVAAIPDYPARTAAQLVNAIKAKIAASAE